MTAPETPQQQRCRYLASDGLQCRHRSLAGHHWCYQHQQDRQNLRRLHAPVLEIPLLDSHAAIQTACTGVARALLSGSLDPSAARVLNATLAVALRALPRPSLAAAPKDQPAEIPEPVAEVVLTPEGEELAPEAPYYGPHGKKKRVWSFAEYLYHQIYPDRKDQPLPEEGYYDPEKGHSEPPPQDLPAHLKPPPLNVPPDYTAANAQAPAPSEADDEVPDFPTPELPPVKVPCLGPLAPGSFGPDPARSGHPAGGFPVPDSRPDFFASQPSQTRNSHPDDLSPKSGILPELQAVAAPTPPNHGNSRAIGSLNKRNDLPLRLSRFFLPLAVRMTAFGVAVRIDGVPGLSVDANAPRTGNWGLEAKN
jgi:hypothetical protein